MQDEARRADATAVPSGKTDWAALDAMTDAEAQAAALADPDCPPPRADQSLRRMAQAKRIRLQLRLSQAEFADRYRIPLPTLVAWERHDSDPDAVAETYLDAIAADPDSLARAVVRERPQPAAAN